MNSHPYLVVFDLFDSDESGLLTREKLLAMFYAVKHLDSVQVEPVKLHRGYTLNSGTTCLQDTSKPFESPVLQSSTDAEDVTLVDTCFRHFAAACITATWIRRLPSCSGASSSQSSRSRACAARLGLCAVDALVLCVSACVCVFVGYEMIITLHVMPRGREILMQESNVQPVDSPVTVRAMMSFMALRGWQG